MCLLGGTNWVFIFQKTTFFIVTAVKTSTLTQVPVLVTPNDRVAHSYGLAWGSPFRRLPPLSRRHGGGTASRLHSKHQTQENIKLKRGA
jgi:hypothetical protein